MRILAAGRRTWRLMLVWWVVLLRRVGLLELRVVLVSAVVPTVGRGSGRRAGGG